MNEYHCCDPSIDETERVRILALTPQSAAEEFAEATIDEYPAEGDVTLPVRVWDDANNETRWQVTRTFRPVYDAQPE